LQLFVFVPKRTQLVPKKTQLGPKRKILVPKRKEFFINEEILNARGDQAFYMGAENAKIQSAEKRAETGGHRVNDDLLYSDVKLAITERMVVSVAPIPRKWLASVPLAPEMETLPLFGWMKVDSFTFPVRPAQQIT
jgi:hypothetical protein